MKLYNGNLDLTTLQLKPYIPSKELIHAVQIAQILRRPLLVKGEPGCGKSKLAEALAAELHGDKFRENYFEWNIKSTSKAMDGLYTINNLQRLSDANMRASINSSENDLSIVLRRINKKNNQFEDRGKYLELGVLGKAFMASIKNPNIPPIVLIDEIDKADIDFPNDLLLELDRMEFTLPEAKDQYGNDITIKANSENKPIIIITSNDEKALPVAFLRRCLFHFIEFSSIKLEEIIKNRFSILDKKDPNILTEAVGHFKKWREVILKNGTGNKNITTSELIDWITIIEHNLLDEDKSTLPEDKSKIINDKNQPFYDSSLFKDLETKRLFARDDLKALIDSVQTIGTAS